MQKGIGDFAQSLINSDISDIHEGKPVGGGDSTWADPSQPDLSRVKVPKDFSSQILQESFEIPMSQIPEVPERVSPPNNYEKMVTRFNALLTEAREILETLGTTTGSIGVATLGKSGGTVSRRDTKVDRKDPQSLRKRILKFKKGNKK